MSIEMHKFLIYDGVKKVEIGRKSVYKSLNSPKERANSMKASKPHKYIFECIILPQ